MKKTYLTLIMVLMLLLSQTAESATVNIDLNTTHQIIRGFGAATPWYLPVATDSEIESAFGTGDGQIGLSILRITVERYRSGWSKYLRSTKKAQDMGAIIIASPWHAPSNLVEYRNGENRIKLDKYDEYAAHLNSFVSYMEDNGVSIYGLSVQNEPDCGDWTNWTPDEMFTFMRDYAGAIQGTNVMAPESYHFDRAYSDRILNNRGAYANTDIICGHIYGGGLSKYPLAEEKGKEVWMTEYLMGENNSGNNMSWAIQLAKNINDVMQADMNAYVWWTMIRYYGPIGDGTRASNPQDPYESYPAKGEVTKKGYVMSQFSRFVRPGYTRVSATARPSFRVYVTAYKSDDTLVIVAINQNSSSREVTFSLSGGSVSSYTKYVTSSSDNVSNQGSVGSTNTLAANSVNTFVGTICSGISGDYNEDLKVDFVDFAILGQGWQTTYDIYTLVDIADNWLYGCSYPENSMGYIGCSMAENVANGYRTVGGRRMWGGYGTGGLVVQNWTDTNSSAWQKFDQQVAQYGQPSAVWIQICIFSWWGATYDEVKQMIANARQHAADGATIYITGQPFYIEDNVCFLAGVDGPQLTDDLAQQAGNDPSQNVIYSGIFTLLDSEVNEVDHCHANSSGETALGNQAVDKFGR
jgi:glucuronoarabinoxylan endo-1,4-beta-xylanase